MITLGERAVGVDDVVRVARGGERVRAGDAVRRRLLAARRVVDALAASDRPIYGLTSALGANTGKPIPPEELAEYQRRAVRARAVGVGEPYPTPCVRAMLFARIAGMAAGGSGISPHVFDALLAMLERRVHPIVPRHGSIGVADLPQLSHLALPLLGEGEAEFAGNRLPGAEALARAGLAPVDLAPKDGLALISANAATVGLAALAVHDAQRVLARMTLATALSFEGFRANPSPLDPRVNAARPAPGQSAAAGELRAHLAGSELLQPGAARRVQDPVSFRCAPSIHGAAAWMLGEAAAQLEIELNSAAESPLVLPDDADMLSNGNFHVPALALALDAAAIALAQVATASVERCVKFMSPAFTDLPLQLTRHGPGHSGFATTQKTLTALAARIRHLANPGSLDFLPVSEGVEDHSPMAVGVAEKLASAADLLRFVAAFELVIAAQAIDLRGTRIAGLGKGTAAAYALTRQHVAPLDEDRPLGPDVDRLARALLAADLADLADLADADVPDVPGVPGVPGIPPAGSAGAAR